MTPELLKEWDLKATAAAMLPSDAQSHDRVMTHRRVFANLAAQWGAAQAQAAGLRGVSDAQELTTVPAHTTRESLGHPTIQAAVEPFAYVTKVGILLPPYKPTPDDVPLFTSPPDHTDAMRLALSMLHFMNDNGYRLDEYEQGRMDAAIAALEKELK